ncbi:MAG: ABC transporter ATP-binding protein [Saprospiraceae bacterium]|nr:ABC transporter ATP-binding protein [Saprospiraceae bacterium]
MIQLKDLSFSYGKGPMLFEGLELSIPGGNIYGLLGKNGAGKTTLLSLISGLLFPKSGSCEVLGHTPRKRQPSFLSDLYFIPEELHIPAMRINTFVDIYSPFYPKFDRAQFSTLLSEFKLSEELKMNKLSYGQKKKVILSFGLATNCKLLILDEPTNGLDIPSKTQLRKILAGAISEDRTFIISTHQVRDLANLMDPIVIINQGKIIFQESIESINSKLQFQLSFREPNVSEVIYAERVPGGFMTINPQNGEGEEEADLEVLFNAVIERTSYFTDLFKTDYDYANE